MALPPLPQTDPTALYRWRDGLYAADLLTAALCHLDFFTWLDEHPSDLAGICTGLGLHERPADVMLTLFTAMGLLERDGARVRLSPTAREHLVRSSPFFLGPYYASFKDRPVCTDLLTVLRTGMPVSWASTSPTGDWATSMKDPAFAERFTAAMDCRGVYLGQAAAAAVDLRAHRALLDVAGGSGVYACAFVERHPHLRATVLERPPVDEVARDSIARRGFAGRVEVVALDMLVDPLPAGFDVHLISNVLHDWPMRRVRTLIAASFAALEPGGWIVIHGAHLDSDKTGPLPAAAYSALLMHATEGRCYAVGELFETLGAAGFIDPRHVDTAADRSLIVGRKA